MLNSALYHLKVWTSSVTAKPVALHHSDHFRVTVVTLIVVAILIILRGAERFVQSLSRLLSVTAYTMRCIVIDRAAEQIIRVSTSRLSVH